MPCNRTNIFGNKIQHLNALKLLIGSTTGIRFTESRQRLVVITSIFQCDNITLSQSRYHHGKFVKITCHPSKLLLCFTSPEISILPLSLRFVIRNAEKSVEIFFYPPLPLIWLLDCCILLNHPPRRVNRKPETFMLLVEFQNTRLVHSGHNLFSFTEISPIYQSDNYRNILTATNKKMERTSKKKHDV